mmetsp:Transcript_75330/g.145675  ORF Transcript_75330/g.145675 Transcript_75330/m.145675 type:complete len:93 (+) Transcript_75330:1175-1453(+)
MTNMIFMHVVDSAEQLPHSNSGLNLTEVTSCDDLVEELAPKAELQNKINVSVVLETFVQFDDIGMVELIHNPDLLSKTSHAASTQLCLADRF